MALRRDQKERIAQIVVKVLYSRFHSFPESSVDNRNAPFHVAFLNAFCDRLVGRVVDIPDYIGLSSWLHGLNTSLGQTFFESVAHILCEGEKRTFSGDQIYTRQLEAISGLMIDLKNGERRPSVQEENRIIFENANGSLQLASQFTVDCFFETDDEVIAIELKSVRPNSGEMRGEKQKILQSKAVLQRVYPSKRIHYYFGFPFDPTSSEETSSNKLRFIRYLIETEKFCDPNEILIADELWSYLSGSENTMSEILTIINAIATPAFMEEFERIQNGTFMKLEEKRSLLERWYLYSEIAIMNRLSRGNILLSCSDRRILNQHVFRPDGSYNENRMRLLSSLESVICNS